MSDNENKKTPEALADEALDAVAGGGFGGMTFGGMITCSMCRVQKGLADFQDPTDPTKILGMCVDCARALGYV